VHPSNATEIESLYRQYGSALLLFSAECKRLFSTIITPGGTIGGKFPRKESAGFQ
jgi:hypothetical protein